MNWLKKIKTLYNCRKEINLEVKKKIDLIAFQKEWRSRNEKNGTIAKNKFDLERVKVGEHPLDMITTFPFASHILNKKNIGYTPTKGEIIVNDDVWLCLGLDLEKIKFLDSQKQDWFMNNAIDDCNIEMVKGWFEGV